MSTPVDAVKALVNKSKVAARTERYVFRERFSEFVIFDDGKREMATCNDRKDAEDIVDALNMLYEIEGER